MITIAGVYVITNGKTGEQYVGVSSRVDERMKWHGSSLRKGKHPVRALQDAWNRDGAESFTFRMLEVIEDERNLYRRERYWLSELRPAYNTVGKRIHAKEQALLNCEPISGAEW